MLAACCLLAKPSGSTRDTDEDYKTKTGLTSLVALTLTMSPVATAAMLRFVRTVERDSALTGAPFIRYIVEVHLKCDASTWRYVSSYTGMHGGRRHKSPTTPNKTTMHPRGSHPANTSDRVPYAEGCSHLFFCGVHLALGVFHRPSQICCGIFCIHPPDLLCKGNGTTLEHSSSPEKCAVNFALDGNANLPTKRMTCRRTPGPQRCTKSADYTSG